MVLQNKKQDPMIIKWIPDISLTELSQGIHAAKWNPCAISTKHEHDDFANIVIMVSCHILSMQSSWHEPWLYRIFDGHVGAVPPTYSCWQHCQGRYRLAVSKYRQWSNQINTNIIVKHSDWQCQHAPRQCGHRGWRATLTLKLTQTDWLHIKQSYIYIHTCISFHYFIRLCTTSINIEYKYSVHAKWRFSWCLWLRCS